MTHKHRTVTESPKAVIVDLAITQDAQFVIGALCIQTKVFTHRIYSEILLLEDDVVDFMTEVIKTTDGIQLVVSDSSVSYLPLFRKVLTDHNISLIRRLRNEFMIEPYLNKLIIPKAV